MKKIIWIAQSILTVFMLFLVTGCKKDEPAKLPVVSTSQVTDITTVTAKCGGSIISNGGSEILANGVCWSTNINPAITDSKTVDDVGTAHFASILSGLTAGTNYHIRAYATNSDGTAYGDDVPFTTSPVLLAEIVTQPVVLVAGTDATTGGTIISDGGGQITARGVCWSKTENPTINNDTTYDGTGSGSFTSTITGLDAQTTYFVRAYATNIAGTVYGNELNVTTWGGKPFATTIDASDVATAGATLRGSVFSNYSPTDVLFEYGTTVNYGETIVANPNPVNSLSEVYVDASLTGLEEGTTYHFRIKAVNSLGTTYGSDLTFTTVSSISVTDKDGNVYKTVTIGNQVWLVENLKTTRYNDDTEITLVTDNAEWTALSAPAYCWYNNDSASYKDSYGALYNWYAVNTGKLCPEGWHVPSYSEWLDLMTFLGGGNEAYGRQTGGSLLKEIGTTHWNDPNYATDQYGFTARPGGLRSENGSFFYIYSFGNWWASGLWWAGGDNGTNFIMANDSEGVSYGSVVKNTGASVRCLKDVF
jgi:uncharacterized protein (TIGR02145 family)